MDIRYKLYPYPVLSYFSDDYSDCYFETAIDAEKDGYALKVTCLGETDNIELLKAITDGKAKYVYHLECAQTGFREVVSTSHKETIRIIPDKNLNGRLQVCPFIVATTDLLGYVNESFHEDYSGFKFNIESGCVLAIGKQVNFDIEKEINDLANTPSVFSIIKNSDDSILEMLVDIHQNKIIIKLPEADYLNLKSLRSNFGVQPVINSLTVVPALLYALEEVVRKNPTERDEFSIYAWYRAVRKALKHNFLCDIGSNEFSEQNMLSLAQKLINIPLSNAFQFLWDGYGASTEEDQV